MLDQPYEGVEIDPVVSLALQLVAVEDTLQDFVEKGMIVFYVDLAKVVKKLVEADLLVL